MSEASLGNCLTVALYLVLPQFHAGQEDKYGDENDNEKKHLLQI